MRRSDISGAKGIFWMTFTAIGLLSRECVTANEVGSDAVLWCATRNANGAIVAGSPIIVSLSMRGKETFAVPTNYHEAIEIVICDYEGVMVGVPARRLRYPHDLYTNIVGNMYVAQVMGAEFLFDGLTNRTGKEVTDYTMKWRLPGVATNSMKLRVVSATDSNDVWRIKLAQADVKVLFDNDYQEALVLIRSVKTATGPLFGTGIWTVESEEAECLYKLGRWQEALDAYNAIYESMKEDRKKGFDFGPLVPGRIRELEKKLSVTPRIDF